MCQPGAEVVHCALATTDRGEQRLTDKEKRGSYMRGALLASIGLGGALTANQTREGWWFLGVLGGLLLAGAGLYLIAKSEEKP